MKRDSLFDQLGRLLDGRGDVAPETVTIREYLTVDAGNGNGGGIGNGTQPTPIPGVPGAPPSGGMVGNKFEGYVWPTCVAGEYTDMRLAFASPLSL